MCCKEILDRTLGKPAALITPVEEVKSDNPIAEVERLELEIKRLSKGGLTYVGIEINRSKTSLKTPPAKTCLDMLERGIGRVVSESPGPVTKPKHSGGRPRGSRDKVRRKPRGLASPPRFQRRRGAFLSRT